MEEKHTPIIDAIDMEILMHRDSHFGSNFQIMVEYYSQDCVGVMPDFSIEEIKKLQQLESDGGSNLSTTYLPESAREVTLKAQEMYKKLRSAYETDTPDSNAILISDLILSEEQTPTKEIQALTVKGKEVVPLLINLLQSELFYDPLFPGYGRSPIFAAKTLSLIQDEQAIAPLFEALGHDNFFTDEEIIKALCSFKKKARDFLLNIVKQKPLSKDNEYAAIVLSSMEEDKKVSKVALELLNDPDVRKRFSLASYLVFTCANLKDEKDRKSFSSLAKQKDIPKELKEEILLVMNGWRR